MSCGKLNQALRLILLFVFVGNSKAGRVIPGYTSNETYSGSEDITTESPTNDAYCCDNILYTVFICIGGLTLPAIICVRICYLTRLRNRDRRRLEAMRRTHVTDNRQTIYTIEQGNNFCDVIVSPPPYDAIFAPPPYDLPPPYTAKPTDSETTIKIPG